MRVAALLVIVIAWAPPTSALPRVPLVPRLALEPADEYENEDEEYEPPHTERLVLEGAAGLAGMLAAGALVFLGSMAIVTEGDPLAFERVSLLGGVLVLTVTLGFLSLAGPLISGSIVHAMAVDDRRASDWGRTVLWGYGILYGGQLIVGLLGGIAPESAKEILVGGLLVLYPAMVAGQVYAANFRGGNEPYDARGLRFTVARF